MADLTKEQKKDYAYKLYLTEKGITQKEIAQRVGATEATISKWIKVNNWDKMRVSLLTTKEEQLASYYAHLDCMNKTIQERDAKDRIPTKDEAKTMADITRSIKNLETEANVGEKMEMGREFLMYVRKTCDFDLAKTIGVIFDNYIKSCMK